MSQISRKIPLAREGSAGTRPTVTCLIDVIDQADPAFMFIAAELQRVRRAAGTLDTESVKRAIEDGRSKHADHLQAELDRHHERIPASIVYYARRGNLVKIGTTTRPQQRFAELMPDEILAWEPGTRAVEADRHQQFRAQRITTSAEYFHLDDALRRHIDAVRQANGAPDPSWSTLRNLPQRPTRLRTPELPATPHLLSLEEGCRIAGVRLGTAHVWIHRGKLRHVLKDTRGKKLYLLCDLKSLAKQGKKAA